MEVAPGNSDPPEPPGAKNSRRNHMLDKPPSASFASLRIIGAEERRGEPRNGRTLSKTCNAKRKNTCPEKGASSCAKEF